MAESKLAAGYGQLLDVSYSSNVLAVLGFYICVIGLLSYFVKEKLYVGEAIVAVGIGVAVGPHGLNWISLSQWTSNDDELGREIVYQITRIVIAIQVLATGVSLRKAYLRDAWKSLAVLLLPVMTCAWLVSAAIIYLLIPGLTYLESLVVAACITPTDPVLAASIVKGRFAEKYVSQHIRDLLGAESGANDGLGFPFIYLAMYLIQRRTSGWSIAQTLRIWIVRIWLYDIALCVVLGFLIGYIARKTLKYAECNKLIDHESFLSYGVGLSFFTLGIVGTLGSDDLLSAFIVGNSFTWDDWFRVQTLDHAFQDVIDTLVDSAIFIFFGTIIPFENFSDSVNSLSPWRLITVGICIMIFRRLPFVMATYKAIPDIHNWKEAAFAGHFGPIGISAVYYVQVALRELPEERTQLRAVITPIVYTIIITSVIVHGITIPLIKFSPSLYYRTKSLGLSRNNTMSQNATSENLALPMPVTSSSNTAVDDTNVFGEDRAEEAANVKKADEELDRQIRQHEEEVQQHVSFSNV